MKLIFRRSVKHANCSEAQGSSKHHEISTALADVGWHRRNYCAVDIALRCFSLDVLVCGILPNWSEWNNERSC